MESPKSLEVIRSDIREFIMRPGLAWDKLSGKTVLIAGANGFLPSYMAAIIVVLNDEVVQKPRLL